MSALVETINNAAAVWKDAMWLALWQSTALAGVVFVLTRLLRRAPARVVFWLWLLVPLRLLIMPVVKLDLPVLPPESSQPAVSVQPPPAPIPVRALPRGPVANRPVVVPGTDAPSIAVSPWAWCVAAWLVGVVVCAVRFATSYWRMRPLVRESAPGEDSALAHAVGRASELLGVRRTPSVRVAQQDVSPFVMGVFHPVVVLPAGLAARVSGEQLLSVVAHEIAHLRRRDTLTGWLVAACQALYYFHPIFYLAKRRIMFERERACDECVLARGSAKAKPYAEALVSAAEACGRARHVASAVVAAESFLDLKARLSAIAANPVPRDRLPRLAVPALALLSVCALPGILLTARSASGTRSRVSFKGVVTDASDRPVDRVHVRCEAIAFDDPPPYVILDEVTTYTDERGRFALSVPSTTGLLQRQRLLVFDHPAYALGWHSGHKSASQQEIHIRLTQPLSVAGVVKDASGRPVVGATVSAGIQALEVKPKPYSGSCEYCQKTKRAVKTGQDGRFRLERIPEGALLHLYVDCKSYAAYSTRDGYRGHAYPIRAGQQNVSIVLQPGGSIQGQLALDGQPYTKAGMQIDVTRPGDDRRSFTDEAGAFAVRGLKGGSYVVFASEAFLRPVDVVCAPVSGVMVKAGAEPTKVTLPLTRGRVVTGRVSDIATGRPVARESVNCLWAAQSARLISAVTDESGQYELRVPTGEEVRLVVDAREGRRSHRFVRNLTAQPGDLPIQVDFKVGVRPQIKGIVVDPEGRPLAGSVMMRGKWVQVEADGRFVVDEPEQLPHTSRAVPLVAFGAERQMGRIVLWTHEQSGQELEVKLAPVASVRARLVDSDGDPARNARVLLRAGADSTLALVWLDGRLKHDGELTFLAPTAGLPLRLWVDAGGRKPLETPVGTLEAGELKDLGTLTVGPEGGKKGRDAVLAGRVVDHEGRPVAGAEVFVAGRRGQTTDSTGGFRATGLPRGKTVRVGVHHPTYGKTSFRNLATGKDDLLLRVLPDGHGRIGKPAPALHVSGWHNSKPLQIEQLRGRIVVLMLGYRSDFEDGTVVGLQDRLSHYGDKGVTLVCVHVPWGVPEEGLDVFLQKHRITAAFAVDGPASAASNDADPDRASYGATYASYHAKNTPSVFVIDHQGTVRAAAQWHEVEGWIERLLAERPQDH